MRKQSKGFLQGFIVAILLLTLALPTFAAWQKEATLHYNDIKITLDGSAVTPKDANGTVVEPFIIDGTTYLPVRAVAEALGLEVSWDNDTYTAKLSSTPTDVDDTDILVVTSDEIKIYFTETTTENGNFNLLFRVENSSDEDLSVKSKDTSINDIALDCTFAIEAAAGKTGTGTMSFPLSDLSAKNISVINKVGFTFTFADPSTGEALFQSTPASLLFK